MYNDVNNRLLSFVCNEGFVHTLTLTGFRTLLGLDCSLWCKITNFRDGRLPNIRDTRCFWAPYLCRKNGKRQEK